MFASLSTSTLFSLLIRREQNERSLTRLEQTLYIYFNRRMSSVNSNLWWSSHQKKKRSPPRKNKIVCCTFKNPSSSLHFHRSISSFFCVCVCKVKLPAGGEGVIRRVLHCITALRSVDHLSRSYPLSLPLSPCLQQPQGRRIPMNNVACMYKSVSQTNRTMTLTFHHRRLKKKKNMPPHTGGDEYNLYFRVSRNHRRKHI